MSISRHVLQRDLTALSSPAIFNGRAYATVASVYLSVV